MAKVHVTVKSVQAANAKLLGRAHVTAPERTTVSSGGFYVVRPASPPSREAIARAGRRALQAFKA